VGSETGIKFTEVGSGRNPLGAEFYSILLSWPSSPSVHITVLYASWMNVGPGIAEYDKCRHLISYNFGLSSLLLGPKLEVQ
jgi:hypothetical protein